ncbi:MAG: hypothetical protein H0V66_10090 [Bdellovibrionales bacterium]|nr:hypothetical protein [Bdellovibrionales bacterium]
MEQHLQYLSQSKPCSRILKSIKGQKFSGQISHGNTKDYRYYYCKDLKQNINAIDLELLIEKRVIKYFKDSDLFKKLITSGFNQRDAQVEKVKKEISVIRLELKAVEKKIVGLIENMAIPSLNASALEQIVLKLNAFEAQKGGLLASIQTKEQMIGHLLCLKEVTASEDKIEKYAKELKNLTRIQKRELLESIFEKIEVMDPYLVKLHLKRPPFRGDIDSVLKNSLVKGKSGGPLVSPPQPFFLTIEVAEIIVYRQAKPYENVSFLTDLYLNRGWSLRRISDELDCSKATVRKKLIEAGIELLEQRHDDYMTLRKKIQAMRERGLSYQAIADAFNHWKVSTRRGEGQWHAKTIRELKI